MAVPKRRRAEARMAVEVALNLVPYVGPTLSQAISLYEGEQRNRKLDALLDEISVRLSALDSKKVDRTFVESDEFNEAAFRAFEAGRTTGHSDKRRLIAAALVGAATVERPAGLDVEAILDTLRQLTTTDLKLARILWDEAGGEDPKSIVTAVVGPADFPDREFHLKRLEAAGLIDSTSGTQFWDGQYKLTATFHRLMALLAAGGA